MRETSDTSSPSSDKFSELQLSNLENGLRLPFLLSRASGRGSAGESISEPALKGILEFCRPFPGSQDVLPKRALR